MNTTAVRPPKWETCLNHLIACLDTVPAEVVMQVKIV